jgi:8-oxo-dGTP diphosphatase
MKQNKHIGVYGIAQKGSEILLIRKSRGPYKGLFDLPGGGVEFAESLEQALHREFKEEIGGEIEIETFHKALDHNSTWIDDGIVTHTHHIALYYLVSLLSDQINTEPDGHDSDGALWLDRSMISKENLSPVAYKALAMLEGLL